MIDMENVSIEHSLSCVICELIDAESAFNSLSPGRYTDYTEYQLEKFL